VSTLIYRLPPVLRGRAAGDLLFTLGGRIVQLLFALAGNVISARTLGPADFGRFGLIIGTVTIAGTLADAGLTFAAVRFIARDRDEHADAALTVARTYLVLRIGCGLLVSLPGILLAEPIALHVLGQPSLTPYLQLAFLILVGLSVSSYPGTVLTGLARFDKIGVAGILNSIITVGGIAVLFLTGALSLGNLVLWNVALPILSTLPTWFFLPVQWLPWRRPSEGNTGQLPIRQAARQLWAFGKWTAASNLGATVAAQIDLILLGRIVGPSAVGIYAVAVTLASRLDILNQSLFTIMMPRASRLRSRGEVRGYLRRLSRAIAVLAAGLVVVALLAQPAIVWLYGDRYAAASALFLLLLFVLVSDLFTTSLSLVAFPLNRPHVLAFIEWIRVVVLALLGWPLITAFGAAGAALSRIASRVVSAVYITAWLRGAARQSSPGENAATLGANDVV
jgi:O-antigen/teichoic acid export membrane protein